MDGIDMSLVDWSRAQFALTAIYHWIFVPLTLGLSWIVAMMHTMYVKTGDEEWGKITKFWMKLFGINFAIGVSTGIILEFQFGTNWSNYSWFVGDIFGAPLAVEGILAFFMESTFIAVMFFGWNRVSKKFHMLSSWLVAIGSNLSALWILVANAWMQNPLGMEFNPDLARNEMVDFFAILFSPTAVHKFLHTLTQAYVVGSMFVVGISAWYLLKNRHTIMAKRSIVIATTFGLIASIMVAWTGDNAGHDIAKTQPMKLAAMEGLYVGTEDAGLSLMGLLNPSKEVGDDKDAFLLDIRVPYALSILANRDMHSFVPGIDDLIYGNEKYNLEPVADKIVKGKVAIKALADYKALKKENKTAEADERLKEFRSNYDYFGYGFFDKPEQLVPPVATTYYSFHIMVALGMYFIALFFLILLTSYKGTIGNQKLLLKLGFWSIPLPFIASELGWVTAELGRQPWSIVNVLPVHISTSSLSTATVQTTFWMFAILFTFLLIAEFKIMIYQIKKGPEGGE